MRKFLFLLLALVSWSAWAAGDDEFPARAGLRAYRAPLEVMVKEAAKGREADPAVMAEAYKQAGDAWQQVSSQELDMAKYGVPADQQEEVWRQVRTVGMLMGYLDQAVKRSNLTLTRQSLDLLVPTYEKLVVSLGAAK
jgi:hypothetical protein